MLSAGWLLAASLAVTAKDPLFTIYDRGYSIWHLISFVLFPMIIDAISKLRKSKADDDDGGDDDWQYDPDIPMGGEAKEIAKKAPIKKKVSTPYPVSL